MSEQGLLSIVARCQPIVQEFLTVMNTVAAHEIADQSDADLANEVGSLLMDIKAALERGK